MTSLTKSVTMDGLKKISPFTVKEAAEYFGVKKNTIHHFLRYGLRPLYFKSRPEKLTTGVGTPEYIYEYVDSIECPHCGEKIKIKELERYASDS